ncbi:hypothetical protein HY642_07125 [Candidatus Woesearchaeota archaeon]|nr:hypothetical protein [Candidatus Woesearchaeota archaeon]
MAIDNLLNQFRKDANDYQATTAGHNREAAEKAENLLAGLKQLQGAVAKGETTGDRIRDYVLLFHGTLAEEAAKPYLMLQDALKPGLSVLVVSERSHELWRDHHSGCVPRFPAQPVEDSAKFGIVTGQLDVDMKEGCLVLPMACYVSRSRRSAWHKHEGNMQLYWTELLTWDELKAVAELRVPYVPPIIPQSRAGIPKDFVEMLARSDPCAMVHIMAGKDVDTYFAGKLSGHRDYTKAMRMLGSDAPGWFSEHYDKEIAEKRAAVLAAVQDVAYGRHKDVVQWLRDALDVGLHESDETITGRKGVVIRLKDLVAGLCEEYKISPD